MTFNCLLTNKTYFKANYIQNSKMLMPQNTDLMYWNKNQKEMVKATKHQVFLLKFSLSQFGYDQTQVCHSDFIAIFLQMICYPIKFVAMKKHQEVFF